MSDIVAQISRGAQNNYFNASYISKNEWDDEYLRQSLTDKLYGHDKYMDFREPTTYKISPQQISKNIVHFEIIPKDSNPCEISNLRLHIKLNNFNESLRTHILHIGIKLIIGGSYIIEMPMITNLFLCKIMKKKIKDTDEELIIPLVLFDMSSHDKFPLYRLTWHSIKIEISDIKCFDISLFVDKYDVETSNEKPFTSIICQTQYNIFNNMKTVFFNHPVQFMCIELDDEDVFTQRKISKISLSLNGFSPIVWDSYRDEILYVKIFDKIISFVSFIPNIKTIKDIRKMFKEIKVERMNNKKFDIRSGINFSRIDKSNISFETDEITNNKFRTITGINLNIMRFTHGMCAIAFAN